MDRQTDGQTDRKMDGQTDITFHGDAESHLKIFHFQTRQSLDSSHVETMNCVNQPEAELEMSQETLSACSEIGDSQETIPYTDDMGLRIRLSF